MLYVDHIEEYGIGLFIEASRRDLEGIVAKPTISLYEKVPGSGSP